MEKKVHDELTIEELLASLENKDLTEEYAKVQFNDTIASFIQAFKIQAGRKLVSGTILHKLYKLWSKDESITSHEFNLRLGKYIPSRKKNTMFYEVNDATLTIAAKVEALQKDKKRDVTKSPTYQKAFERFIADTKLAKGNCWVENDVLYYSYTRWCDKKKVKVPIGVDNFTAMLSKYFKSKRLSNSKFYWWGVNDEIQNLIDFEEVKRWREGRKNKSVKKNSEEEDFGRPYDGYAKNCLYNGTWPKKTYG